MSKVAIGLTRAIARNGAARSSATPSSAAIGRIEVTTRSPGTTSAIQPAAAARACWPHATERDDHRQPDGQAAERQRRPAPVADDRAAGEALLEPEDGRERRPGDAGDGRQDERDQQRGDEQDRVDDEGLDDTGAAGAARQDDDADERDGHEDDRPASAAGRLARAGADRDAP